MTSTVLAAPMPYDPSARIIACEAPGCDKTFPVGDSYSFVITFATTGPAIAHPAGPRRLLPVQCPQEQHFACCPEHAQIVGHACLDEHIAPLHAAQVAALQATPPEKPKKGTN